LQQTAAWQPCARSRAECRPRELPRNDEAEALFGGTFVLFWLRARSFFVDYRGKPVVVGHTVTEDLPQELSHHTPDDPSDLFAGECVFRLDTGCGCGGFLSALELPTRTVYESR
jgi:hypothetical protein